MPAAATGAAFVAAALLHGWGWLRLRAVLPGAASPRQPAAFSAGLLVLWVAVASPLAHLDHALLTAHMVQHLLIMTVAAPLLLSGAPLLVAAGGLLPTPLAARARPLVRSGPARAAAHLVTHPVVCWLAGTGVVLAWHVPRVFALAARAPDWHALQHATFLAAGLLFWWPVLLPWPGAARWPVGAMPLYLFLATLPCDALSAFLAFSGRVVYPQYLAAHPPLGLTPLADQECAGALMWLWVTVAYLVPAVVLTLRLLSPAPPGASLDP